MDKLDTYYHMLGSVGYYTLQATIANNTGLKMQAAEDYQSKDTFNGERVRSYEEFVIANYLFLNGIKYEYEKEFPKDEWGEYNGKPYTPDFYLTEYDLYWEHFGVNKEEHLPYMSKKDEERYIDIMNLKRKKYKELKRELIESYSWQFTDGKIYKYLDKIFEKFKIKKKPIDTSEIVQILMTRAKNRLFTQSKSLIENYLNLYKSRLFQKKDLNYAKSLVPCFTGFEQERKDLFFYIFKEIYNEYEQILKDENKLDFNDMISEAITQIKSGRYKIIYDYIIVDEYQDMSYSRQELLKAILCQRDNIKLFGVGDDWQSIYGFTGSDLNYFLKFSDYWEHALQLKIEQTHRNSQELVNLAGNFIMKNPNQIKKNLKAIPCNEKPVSILIYDNIKKDDNIKKGTDIKTSASIYAVKEAINLLRSKVENKGDTLKDEDILILGRNNSIIDNIKNYTKSKYTYNTVHRSKGSEAKVVILADVLDGIAGFPNQMSDDIILQSLLAEPEKFKYAQERRLFYVGLTRTKSYVAITTEKLKTSSFINEIIQEHEYVDCINISPSKLEDNYEIPTCDLCGGRMTIRTGPYGKFWGCTNYNNGKEEKGCRGKKKFVDYW